MVAVISVVTNHGEKLDNSTNAAHGTKNLWMRPAYGRTFTGFTGDINGITEG
jgi:hypothetical protein